MHLQQVINHCYFEQSAKPNQKLHGVLGGANGLFDERLI